MGAARHREEQKMSRFYAIDLHCKQGVIAIAGCAMHDFLGLVIRLYSPPEPQSRRKAAVGIAGCGVSLRVLPPIGNRRSERQTLQADRLFLRPQKSGSRLAPPPHSNGETLQYPQLPAQQRDTDQQGLVLPRTPGVMDWCVETRHRPSSLFESEDLVFSDTEKVGNVPIRISATARDVG